MKHLLPLILILFLFTTCSKEEKIEQFDLTIEVNPSDAGTINPSSGKYDSGKEVNLVATPAEGYAFKSWGGAVSSEKNPFTLAISSDTKITAAFEKLDGDGDGIPDDVDECSDTPAGETVDAQGCSDTQKDTDADGVSDNLDECPDTPEGDTVGSNGCTPVPDDSDNDGVIDDVDLCASTPTGETVDANGCSDSQKDSDGDGVVDTIDQCPDTPEGDIVNEQGCSNTQADSDDDGVMDDSDECPSTPKDATVDENGCSESQRDSDKDGVANDLDKCADTPEGETVDEQGCSKSQIDSDNDGINDAADECPETPEGDTVDEQGCSESQKDSDGDGISDLIDACPETPEGETVNESGCVETLTTYIPDDIFEQQLIDLGYDDVLDNYVLTENISSIEIFSLGNDEAFIADFTGLNAFVSLRSLNILFASDNKFSFETTNFPNLTDLYLDYVEIKSLKIDENSMLQTFVAGEGVRIEALKAINNSAIKRISFEKSNVGSIFISGNTNLESFGTFDTNVEEAVIRNNMSLKGLSFSDSGLKNLDFSNNPALEFLKLKLLNDIEFPLDLVTYPNLEFVEIRNYFLSSSIDFSNNTLLETLILSNSGLTALDVSNNTGLLFLEAFSNSLTCIKLNQEQFDNIPSGWSKSSDATYSLECAD